jgi:hypothetical protein
MKLTKPQKILLEVLKTESQGEENCCVEIEPNELRTAKALERKGLITLDGDHIAIVNIEKSGYPFGKVRDFFTQLLADNQPPRIINIGYFLCEAKRLIKEIDAAESPGQTRQP